MEPRIFRAAALVCMLALSAGAACSESDTSDPAPAQKTDPTTEAAAPAEPTPEPTPEVVTDDPFQPPNAVFKGRIRKGQTLNPKLRRNGLSPKQSLELVQTLKPLINLDRKARPNDTYSLATNDEGDVVAFDYKSKRGGVFHVRRQGERLVASKDAPPDLILNAEDPTLQAQELPPNRDPGPGSPLLAEASEDAPEEDADDPMVVESPQVPVNEVDEPKPEADKNTPEPVEIAAKAPEKAPEAVPEEAPEEADKAPEEAPMTAAQKRAEQRRQAREARVAERKAAREQAKKEREDKEAKRLADKEKARKAKEAEARHARKEKERQQRQAERQVDAKNLPRDRAKLVRAWYNTDDKALRRVIARTLQRTAGIQGTRKALVRAFRPRKTAGNGLQIRTIRVGKRNDRYGLYVPKKYRPGRALPLHISLHGGGGNGPGTCQRRWGDSWPKDFILVCPSTPGGRWWSPQGEATVLAIYREILRDYNVQADRVSLGGLSNGGTGTFHLATKYPWLWAAVVPRCPARFVNEDWYRNMTALPTYVIHGSQDHQIVPSNSQWIVKHLKNLGSKPRYVEVPGGGHDFFSNLNPQVVKWMLPKKRKKVRKFTYHRTRGPEPELIYWLSIKGAGRIDASMTRRSGTTIVKIKTERDPRALKVYIPKDMIAGKTRVVLNGRAVYTGKTPSSASDVLQSFAKTGDLRRVFSASVTIR